VFRKPGAVHGFLHDIPQDGPKPCRGRNASQDGFEGKEEVLELEL